MFVECALPCQALLHIAGTDEGQGADDAAGIARGAQRQGDGMLLRRACGGNHLGAQVAQQIAAFIEHADRVMVAAQRQQRNACLVQPGDQLVVQLAGIAGRCAGVEDIAGNQHGIHPMGTDLRHQPVNQRPVFGLAALAHEMLAQVPVGGVEDAHVVIGENSRLS
ncbi:hypothetical protein D3C72_1035230 [compost metagenome]